MFSQNPLSCLLALLLAAVSLQAAPKLRLSTAAVGPLPTNPGANAGPVSVEAYNAGDGSLNLSVASSAPWLTASVGAPRTCSNREGTCLPIQLQLLTASLARGRYTGLVTVSDPNALDAPQSITVTVHVGGSLPERIQLYVPPNGAADTFTFYTTGPIEATAGAQSGGNWLSVALDGGGSFRFALPYTIRARHLEGMPEGVYSGTVTIARSPVAADNRSVPVTLQVTSQPIASASPGEVQFRIAAGAPPQRAFVALSNRGLGSLAIANISATTESGGSWLSAEPSGTANVVALTANVQNLGQGSYQGALTLATNAVNGPVSVPVRLSVVAPGPPAAAFGGVLNSGNFDDGLAPGGVAAIFGEQLSMQAPAGASAVPLPQELAGVRVFVNERPAPLFYAAYNQVNIQIPFETPEGEAVIRVERQGVRGNGVTARIRARAPRIIQVGDSGVVVNQDGSLAIRGGRPARPGEVLTIYCVGLGMTDPVVATGAGSPGVEPLGRVQPAPKVVFGNVFSGVSVVEPFYAGLTPGLVGLYQVNVFVPADVPRGEVLLSLEGESYQSNRVVVPIER